MTGEQPFQCSLYSCSALDAEGRPSIDSGEESQREPPSTQPLLTQKSTPCLDDLDDSAGLQRMLLNALEGISFLTDEVAKLRQGNERLCRDNARAFAQQADIIASLRVEVRSLRGELSRRAGSFLPVPSPPSTPTLNGTAAGASLRREPSSTFAGAVANMNGTVADTEPDQPMPGSTTSLPSPLLGPPSSATPRTDSVKSNKKNGSAACVGAADTTLISVVQRLKRPRRIFVSKLSPCTTSAQLTAHLSSVDVTPLSCQRLKTKYDSYSSFCVTVSEDSFQHLADPSLWPKDCLFKPFRGKLLPEMILTTDVA